MSVSDAHTVKDDVRSWSSLSDSNDDGSSDGDGDDEPEDSTAKEPWNAAGIKSFDVAPSSIAVCPGCGGKILKGTYRLDYRKRLRLRSAIAFQVLHLIKNNLHCLGSRAWVIQLNQL